MKANIKKDTIIIIEFLILITLWLIVFASPVIVQLTNDDIIWDKIFANWKRLMPFFILSLFNHFVLFPMLFIRRNKAWYLLGTVLTLVMFSFLLVVLRPLQKDNLPPRMHQEGEMHRPPPPPPHATMRDNQQAQRLHQPVPGPQSPGALPPFINSALIALLIIGFDTGLRTVFRWTRSEQERDKLEKEKVKTELAFLRNQVNPHFLMNTLNNIHALIDFDINEAKETVIQLSRLMRYLLYDTERDLIPIKEELGFIRSYVDLMIMRLSDRVKVTLDINVPDEKKNIPPLLFNSLIENAFKYGISHRIDTFIKIDLSTTENELIFNLSNTIVQKKKENSFYSGIGLDNTKKRLDILYANSYSLNISSENDIFSVQLKLPL